MALETLRKHRTLLIQSILVWSLCGSTSAQEPSKSDGSDLGLTIMGAIVQREDDNNVALIKEAQSGSVKAVKKGFIINEKYKVVEVHAKYMLLIDKSAKKFLVFQDKFASEFKNAPPPLTTPGVSQAMVATDHYKEEGFERNQGSIQMTEGYRDKIVKQDLAKVLMQATAEPFIDNGQIVGFKMSQIDSDSIYAKGGLIESDIVTVLNGTRLNSVAGAITLLKSLKSAEAIEIEVLRGGSPLKLSIQVH